MRRTVRIQSGNLRHSLYLKQDVRVEDGAGGFTLNPQTIATVDAYIRPLTGQEFYVAEQQKLSTTEIIEIRYFEGLTHAMYFEHTISHLIYAIRSIINVEERNRKHIIFVEQRGDLV